MRFFVHYFPHSVANTPDILQFFLHFIYGMLFIVSQSIAPLVSAEGEQTLFIVKAWFIKGIFTAIFYYYCLIDEC